MGKYTWPDALHTYSLKGYGLDVRDINATLASNKAVFGKSMSRKSGVCMFLFYPTLYSTTLTTCPYLEQSNESGSDSTHVSSFLGSMNTF